MYNVRASTNSNTVSGKQPCHTVTTKLWLGVCECMYGSISLHVSAGKSRYAMSCYAI